MHLLYVHHYPIDEEAANIIQVLYMCYALQKSGLSVTLLSPLSKKNNSKRLRFLAEQKLGRKIIFNLDFFKLTRTIFGHSLSAYLSLKKPLKKYKSSNYVFCRHPLTNIVCLKKGFKVLFELHSSDFYKYKILNHFLEKCVIWKSKYNNQIANIFISQALASYWNKKGIPVAKTVVLHDGALEEDFAKDPGIINAKSHLKIILNKKNIVYIGSLYRDRNVEFILKLAEDFSDFEFSVVGGPLDRMNYYKNLSQKKGIQNITFYGYVGRKDILWHLFSADILLLIWSWQVATINICSPLKVFESMAAQRIIVAQAFPTITEVLRNDENAILCSPDNYNELKNGIIKASSIEYPNRISENAKNDFVNYYSWERRSMAVMKILKKSGMAC